MPMPIRGRANLEEQESRELSYRDRWREETPEYQALSYRNKMQVRRLLARGKASTDPRLAAATVEIAEQYKGRGSARWVRVGLWLLTPLFLAVSILNVLDGDTLGAIVYALLALVWLLQLLLSPELRPKHAARSMEASRRIVAAGSG